MHKSAGAQLSGEGFSDDPDPALAKLNGEEKFTLRLYIAGQTPRSVAALANLRKLCEEYLPGRYDLEVIDLILNPKRARTDQILAIPTLVRSLPIPIARIIGDLSDTDNVLLGLNIHKRPAAQGW